MKLPQADNLKKTAWNKGIYNLIVYLVLFNILIQFQTLKVIMILLNCFFSLK